MPGIEESENEWRYRIEDPDKYDSDSFRRGPYPPKKPFAGVSAIWGCPKGSWSGGRCQVGMQLQALRFKKTVFKTREQVRAWLKKHGFMKGIEGGATDMDIADTVFEPQRIVRLEMKANADKRTKVEMWEDETGRYFRVPVTGRGIDLHRERIAKESVDMMVETFRNRKIGLFPDHGAKPSAGGGPFGPARVYSWRDFMGWSSDAEIRGRGTSELVWVTWRLNEKHPDASLLWDFLAEGCPIGFSIGFLVKEERKVEVEIE